MHSPIRTDNKPYYIKISKKSYFYIKQSLYGVLFLVLRNSTVVTTFQTTLIDFSLVLNQYTFAPKQLMSLNAIDITEMNKIRCFQLPKQILLTGAAFFI